jgi:hypothetical protein
MIPAFLLMKMMDKEVKNPKVLNHPSALRETSVSSLILTNLPSLTLDYQEGN